MNKLRKTGIVVLILIVLCAFTGCAMAQTSLTINETDGELVANIELNCSVTVDYLPDDFKPVSFLVSSGSQYVILPYSISSAQNPTVIVYFSWSDLKGDNPIILGYESELLNKKFFVQIENSNSVVINSDGKITKFESVDSYKTHKLTITNNTVTLDNESKDLNGGLPNGGINPYLYALNKDNTSVVYSEDTNLSIWNIQMFYGGELKCNLVPTSHEVIDEALFYDTMNSKFIETQNGSLTAGTDGVCIYNFQEKIDDVWTTFDEKINETSTSLTIADESPKEHQFRCLVTGYAQISNIIAYTSEIPLSVALASSMTGVANESIQFTSAVNGNAVEYLWEFGDGTTSNEKNPTHTYAQNGNYQVTLTVASATGTTNTTGTITVTSKEKWYEINNKMDLNSSSAIVILGVLTLVLAGLFLFVVVKNGGRISFPLLMTFVLLLAVIYVVILVGGTLSSVSADRFG